MLAFSHDPEAGTIYLYFTELEQGQAVDTLEYPAALLLDGAGRIFGVQLRLDDEVTLGQLDLALEGDYERLDMQSGRLTIRIAEEEPAELRELAETAILDLDGDETVLGVELAVPAELRSPEALARLAPLMVDLDDAPAAGEGPVVLAPQAGAAGEGEAAAATAQGQRAAEEPGSLAEPAGPPAASTPSAALIRAGFVALVGKPNVGKSTLLNALLGQKIAPVSPRPQTTRVPVRGILHRPGAQIVFVDTPGIHRPSHALGKLMVDLAQRTLPNADLIGFMVDISQPPSQLDRQIAQQVRRARAPKLLILNKVDLPTRGGGSYLAEFQELGPWDMELAISAQRREGLGALLEEIVARLPEGPPLYPADQVTDQSEQQLAAELVREKALLFTQQEVPHALAVEVEEWEQRDAATYIRMTLNVEREGQKAILIGAGGAMLKRIGSSARREIEQALGRTIFLDLWVKVRENWRDDPTALGWLGYRSRDFQ